MTGENGDPRMARGTGAVTVAGVIQSPPPELAQAAAELRTRTRAEQGLDPTVTDPAILRRVADVVRPPTVATLAARSRRRAA